MALRSTSQLRTLWGPACRFRKITIGLYGTGRVTVDVRTKEAVYEFNRCLARNRYPSIYIQTGAFVCRAITDGVGYSLHAFGIAIDLNWLVNGRGYHATHNIPDALVRDVLAIRTNSGAQVWGWGGNYTTAPPDYMHFEIVASPAELATGIRTGSTPVNEEFVMDAEAKAAFTAIEKQNAAQLAWMLRMEARIEELEKDRWLPTTKRVRVLVEDAGIKDPA